MKPEKIHSALLKWYVTEKRDLPWRRSKDPYRIWLSEIMLQQTRVETVLPYYERFLSNFPTVHDLANAEIDRVTNLWAGLGYYSRARNLHEAAKQVSQKMAGRFPQKLEDLRTLKGVGPYTAAAIASIAFDAAHCALDGNLERVFARLLALKANPKTVGRKAVLECGEKLVSLGQAGDLNQAVMDLSAKVCLPRQPRCEICPVASYCEARKLGLQTELPVKPAKAEKVQLKAAAWIVLANEELLLARRPKSQWLAGMWDIPWKIQEKENRRVVPPFGSLVSTCSTSRTITKHKIEFEVRGLVCEKKPTERELKRLEANVDEFRWVKLQELHGIHLPRPSEKALEKLLPELVAPL